jgi:hypothetical protein
MVAFIILPIGLMAAFISIKGLIDNGPYNGNLIYDYFRYTSTAPSPSNLFFYDYGFASEAG